MTVVAPTAPRANHGGFRLPIILSVSGLRKKRNVSKKRKLENFYNFVI